MQASTEEAVRKAANSWDQAFQEPIQVLDHGFVRLVDWMGDDTAVVDAARVSYGPGTSRVNDNRNLIRYLMRHRHTSPFEQCEIKLHLKMPIFVARQWIRHRTASLNEVSGRYSVIKDEFYLPGAENWRTQSSTNKQGSDGTHQLGFMAEAEYTDLFEQAKDNYTAAIDKGIAREQARIGLPLATYTEFYWKIDVHNLLHFLSLRMDDHAQQEIRVYAEAIAEIVSEWMPTTWEAFVDYRLEALTLTRLDIMVINAITAEFNPHHAMDLAYSYGWLKKHSRERQEFEAKAASLGLTVPWQESNLE